MKALEVTERYFEAGSCGNPETYQIVKNKGDPEKGAVRVLVAYPQYVTSNSSVRP